MTCLRLTALATTGRLLLVLTALGLAVPGPAASRPRGPSAVAGTLAPRPLQPPVPGSPVVVHPFDPPRSRWGPGHRGVDLMAAAGTAVLAPADGVVTFASDVAGRPVLTITLDCGLRSSLEPVAGTVPVGTHVRAGDQVGVVVHSAASHCAPADCLHWGVRRGETYLDPWALLTGVGPVVLLTRSRAPPHGGGAHRPALAVRGRRRHG